MKPISIDSAVQKWWSCRFNVPGGFGCFFGRCRLVLLCKLNKTALLYCGAQIYICFYRLCIEKLHIKVEGQYIRGSPFPVTVYRPANLKQLKREVLAKSGYPSCSSLPIQHPGDGTLCRRKHFANQKSCSCLLPYWLILILIYLLH